jgi:tetratricopeptide (TPR) repeat protein
VEQVKSAAIALGLVLLVAASAWPAQEPQEVNALFEEACELYESSEFEGALSIFESLVSAGVRDAALYYNLGNCYYHLGRVGKAIISYRRARILAPRDEDIRANLAFLRSSVGFRDTTDSFDPGSMATLPGRIASPREWQVVFYAAYYLGAASFVAVLFLSGPLRRHALRVLSLLIVIAIVCWAFAYMGRHRFSAGTEGAVIADRSELMSGPGAAFEELARLPDGVEVTLRARSGIWVEVRLPTGEIGWLRETNIQTL